MTLDQALTESARYANSIGQRAHNLTYGASQHMPEHKSSTMLTLTLDDRQGQCTLALSDGSWASTYAYTSDEDTRDLWDWFHAELRDWQENGFILSDEDWEPEYLD